MTGPVGARHDLAHGWAAALIVLSIFNVAGLLLTARRWQGWVRWPDSVAFSASRCTSWLLDRDHFTQYPTHLPVFVYAAMLWAVASMRPRLEPSLAARVRTRAAGQWGC